MQNLLLLPPANRCQANAKPLLQRKWRVDGRDGAWKASQTLSPEGWPRRSFCCQEEGRVRAVRATPGT